LKNGTLSKTIEERHIKQNHWRGASSENKITLQEPHKISLKRFLFWSSFKLNEPNKINYSEEVFLWNSFKLQKSNKISLRFWSMACNGPSTWVWWFTSNSKTYGINIKLKLGKFKFNHYISGLPLVQSNSQRPFSDFTCMVRWSYDVPCKTRSSFEPDIVKKTNHTCLGHVPGALSVPYKFGGLSLKSILGISLPYVF
jgi:hypothetical protein